MHWGYLRKEIYEVLAKNNFYVDLGTSVENMDLESMSESTLSFCGIRTLLLEPKTVL